VTDVHEACEAATEDGTHARSVKTAIGRYGYRSAVDRSLGDRLRGVDDRIWDGLLAALLLAVGLLGFGLRGHTPDEPPEALGYALVAISTVPTAWRRRAPLVVFAIVALAASCAALLGYWPEFVIPTWVASYSAAAFCARDDVLRVVVPLGVATSVAISLGERWQRGLNWVEVLADLIVTFGIPLLLGRLTYNRRRRAAADREHAAAEAVAEERARIARELHDVVAHHISVMVVQAGVARAVGASDPAAAANALRQIEASGRTGLAEMQRLLGILKAPGGGGALEPQPGLERLPELLEATRNAGLRVEAIVEGSPRQLPPGVDLSAYRIVQEALTNTLRHAGEARARVSIRYVVDAIEIEVVDDGGGTGAEPKGGAGHGLIGMRERVQVFGGVLDAGRQSGGGFRIRARIPAAEAEP
jgi:signal transduction histidine kinase